MIDDQLSNDRQPDDRLLKTELASLVAPQIDPALLSVLDQAEFSLRDAEQQARSIYVTFSRIHPEEVTPQSIEAFHDLIERWYRAHRGWANLCRQRCREIEVMGAAVERDRMNQLGGNKHPGNDQGTPGNTDGVGSLDCPYCGVRVSDSVRYLGQAILCPKCNGTFRAPESRENVLMMQLVIPVITGGLLILVVYFLIQSFLLAP